MRLLQAFLHLFVPCTPARCPDGSSGAFNSEFNVAIFRCRCCGRRRMRRYW